MSFFKKINLSLGKKKDDEYEEEVPEGEEGEEIADDQEEEEEEPEEEPEEEEEEPEEEEEEPEEDEPEVDEEKVEALKAKAKVAMDVGFNCVVGKDTWDENEERRGNERVLVISIWRDL